MNHIYRRSGFTLVELLIVIAIVCILLSIVGSAFGGCDAITGFARERRARAENDAKSYVQQLHPSYTNTRALCQSTDSDNDGYVTCTVISTVNGTDTPEEGIECRASVYFDFARGCRPMRTIMRMR